MTRDEAIQRIFTHCPNFAPSQRIPLLEALVALDLIKFDEPKSMPQKLRDFVSDTRLAQGDAMQRLGALQHVLADCGLKIIER